jgi:hypothetical protein
VGEDPPDLDGARVRHRRDTRSRIELGQGDGRLALGKACGTLASLRIGCGSIER